jgi:hypothetical protein
MGPGSFVPVFVGGGLLGCPGERIYRMDKGAGDIYRMFEGITTKSQEAPR